MTFDLQKFLLKMYTDFMKHAVSAKFYSQLGLILIGIILAYSLAKKLEKAKVFHSLDHEPEASLFRVYLSQFRDLIVPLLIVLFLSIGVDLSDYLLKSSSIIKVFLSLSVVYMIYAFINRFVVKKLIRKIIVTLVIPIALLKVFGVLGYVIKYLDSRSLELGTMKISLYGLIRVTLFGTILFWLGKTSNKIGQDVIRRQEDIEIGTREVFAKLFQVVLVSVLFILLLQIMGINLTTLAVFGGALGVGLGFGLQAIASNFISGIIILLERSISVGDYVDMGNGKAGVIRELNMRSATVESFDGKDIMIPNEKFITTEFTNWTRKDQKLRYSLTFQVSYDTDLEKMLELVKDAVRAHPKVLEGEHLPIEERADAEIKSFADSGVEILVEFWMEGIDDGVNRVGADLLMIIWKVLKENNIEIPYPQRVVHLPKNSRSFQISN